MINAMGTPTWGNKMEYVFHSLMHMKEPLHRHTQIASTSWNPQGLFRPVMGVLYLSVMLQMFLNKRHYGR